MLIHLWETNQWLIGIAASLVVPLILLLMFVRARYLEYHRLRNIMRNGTAQVLRRVLCVRRIPESIFEERTLKGLVYATYELGTTRSQRYVFRKAVLAEAPALAPYLIKLMEMCPHPRCTIKTILFPTI